MGQESLRLAAGVRPRASGGHRLNSPRPAHQPPPHPGTSTMHASSRSSAGLPVRGFHRTNPSTQRARQKPPHAAVSLRLVPRRRQRARGRAGHARARVCLLWPWHAAVAIASSRIWDPPTPRVTCAVQWRGEDSREGVQVQGTCPRSPDVFSRLIIWWVAIVVVVVLRSLASSFVRSAVPAASLS